MEYLDKKRVSLVFKDKDGKVSRKRKIVYGTYFSNVKDKTGKEYQLFYQDKITEYLGMRLNNPKIGIVVRASFYPISTHEGFRDMQLDIRDKISKLDIKESIKTMR